MASDVDDRAAKMSGRQRFDQVRLHDRAAATLTK